MSFSLPADLATDFVDDESEVDAAYFNGVSGMGNAVKAAIATLGFNSATATVNTSETTTSTTYADLATTTDQITVPIGSSGKALVFFQAKMSNSGANYNYVSLELSGANTVAASDGICIQHASSAANIQRQSGTPLLLTGLTEGFTTFKLKYRTNTGTATFSNRRITVIPLPSTDGTHASGAINLDSSSAVSLGMSGSPYNRPACVGVGAGATSATSPISFSDTVPADTDCTLIWVAHYNSSASPTITGSVGGQSGALIKTTTCAASNNARISCVAVMNPPTGTQTVSVTNSHPSGAVITTCHYANVTAVGAYTETASGSPASCSVAASSTDARYDYAAGYSYAAAGTSNTFSHDFTGTERFLQTGGAGATSPPMFVGDSYGNYGTLTSTVTRSNSAYGYGALMVKLFSPATSFTPTVTPGFAFTGRSTEAVTFDSVGAGVVGVAGTTYSWSHTIGANAKALVVAANFYNVGLASPTFTNAKVGTTDLSVLGVFRNYTSSGWPCYTALLGVLNPPTGTQTVQFTTAATYTGCNSFAYNNVASFGAFATTTSDGSVGTPATYTGPATNGENMVFQMFAGYTTAFSSYTGGTQRWNPSRGTSLAYVVGDAVGTGSSINFSAVHGAYSYGAVSLILNAK